MYRLCAGKKNATGDSKVNSAPIYHILHKTAVGASSLRRTQNLFTDFVSPTGTFNLFKPHAKDVEPMATIRGKERVCAAHLLVSGDQGGPFAG